MVQFLHFGPPEHTEMLNLGESHRSTVPLATAAIISELIRRREADLCLFASQFDAGSHFGHVGR